MGRRWTRQEDRLSSANYMLVKQKAMLTINNKMLKDNGEMLKTSVPVVNGACLPSVRRVILVLAHRPTFMHRYIVTIRLHQHILMMIEMSTPPLATVLFWWRVGIL